MQFKNRLSSYVAAAFPNDTTSKIITPDMLESMDRWINIYMNRPFWYIGSSDMRRLNLAAPICSEYARLITTELKSAVTGSSKRASFLNENYSRLLRSLRSQIEYACACGGVIFKPYVCGGKILADCIPQASVYPFSYTDERITGIIACDSLVNGKSFFKRLERHEYINGTHKITNRAFFSVDNNSLGKEIPLTEVEQWQSIDPEIVIEGVDRPLFGYFKPAFANQVDPTSPLGVAVFSRATEDLAEADRQATKLQWEYNAAQMAIDASEDILRARTDDEGRIKYSIPEASARIFRKINADGADGTFYKVFAPALRDKNYSDGLESLKREIEFKSSLAYGTLSKIDAVEKTAEEIRSSKQRSYSTICDCQNNLRFALDDYIYAMDKLCSYCGLAPEGAYEVQHNFGDGILEDARVEQQIRLNEVTAGILDPVEYLKWRYNATDEQARAMLPAAQEGFFGDA